MPRKVQKKRVNVTIDREVMEDAKAYELNVSAAAEAGIKAALKKSKEEQWREENAEAIVAHNKRIAEEGPMLRPHWLDVADEDW